MASEKSQNSLQIWQIAKINLRHNFVPLLLLAAVVMVLTPVLFGTTNLDRLAAAAPLEMFVSTIGIILLVPIFQPEQNSEIEDIVTSQYVDCVYVYMIRVTYSVIGLVLLILLFSGYMLICGCDISVALIFGTLADAMFLGSIGLLVAAVTNNLPVSLMASILYYGLNLFARSKVGAFNLFSMMNGDYSSNIWLFAVSIVLIIAAVILKRVTVKCR